MGRCSLGSGAAHSWWGVPSPWELETEVTCEHQAFSVSRGLTDATQGGRGALTRGGGLNPQGLSWSVGIRDLGLLGICAPFIGQLPWRHIRDHQRTESQHLSEAEGLPTLLLSRSVALGRRLSYLPHRTGRALMASPGGRAPGGSASCGCRAPWAGSQNLFIQGGRGGSPLVPQCSCPCLFGQDPPARNSCAVSQSPWPAGAAGLSASRACPRLRPLNTGVRAWGADWS